MSKYNAIGIQGTDLAGETGNELLPQPADRRWREPVGQYNACPNALLLNHLAEGVTDPVLFANGLGGTCIAAAPTPCDEDADCAVGRYLHNGPPQILDRTGRA